MIWDAVASQWAAVVRQDLQGGGARENLLHPALFELIGSVEGKKVLDAGCGEGYLSRLLASRGARVTGVDFSAQLIREANRLEEEKKLGITYLQSDLADLSALLDGEFQLVVSSMVLNTLENLEGTLRTLSRVLAPEGILVMSIVHPCFDGVGAGWVQRGGGTRWSINRYVDQVEGRNALGARVFHRPLSQYVSHAVNAGLLLDAMREPTAPEELSMRLAPAERAYDQIPTLLLMRFVKRPGGLTT